jgi:mannosyltransferase OCH1-like enzyme
MENKKNIFIIYMINFKFYRKPKNMSMNITKKDSYKKIIENIQISKQNRKYLLKGYYNSIIPLKVYMTWGSKNLPEKMQKNIEKLKSDNPEFEFFLYDDNDCINFIKENFDNEVLWAFNKLVPGAYKADLWRLCILYKYGGYYLDIKENCLNGFKLIELSENEHFVLDRPPDHILNALIVCKPNNLFLLKCIEEIINNIKNNYYGPGCLWPTGPGLLGNVAKKYNFKLNLDLYLPQHGEFIVYKGIGIMKGYDGYVSERALHQKTRHYGELWDQKKIYN